MAKLINTLNVGDKIKFGTYKVENSSIEPIIWKVADKNHAGYPANSTTLITEKIIDLRGFDAKEPNNARIDQKMYGYNRYRYSNMRQWLNKSGSNWFVKQHETDEAPTDDLMSEPTGYNDGAGFLSNFSDGELTLLMPTNIKVVLNTFDGGGFENLTDLVFLPSVTEIGSNNEPTGAEGALLSLFSDNTNKLAYLTKQCFDNTLSSGKPSAVNKAWKWRLRTPQYDNVLIVRCQNDQVNALYNSYSCEGSMGVRPLCNIKSDVIVSDTADADGCYRILWAPDKPTGLSPSSEVKMNNEIIRFAWTHNNISGDAQSKFDLQWSSNGGQTWNTITQTTSNQYYDMPTNTLPAGSIVWRVRTYSADGLVGAYSDQVAFTAAGKPDTPVITLPNAIENTSRPVIAWTGVGQVMYQAQVLQGANIVWNSGEIASTSGQVQVGADLADETSYTAKVRIKNQYDLWSNWASKAFTVDFELPNKPAFEIVKDLVRASIRLTITNPTPDGAGGFAHNEIYRRKVGGTWIRIATGIERNGTYEDCTMASSQPYEYIVRTIGTYGYMDSDVKYADIRVRNSQLASISDKDIYVPLIYNPQRNISLGMSRTLMQFTGRKKPVAEFSEHVDFGLALSFVVKDIEDIDTLMALVESAETLLYRDNRGRKIYCTIGSLDIDEERKYWTVSFAIAEVSHQEGV